MSILTPPTVMSPAAPTPATRRRSRPNVCPALTTEPTAWTELADATARFMSANTCAGGFDASPFDFAPPPQPARIAPARTSTAGACTRISAILRLYDRSVDARGIHHVGLAVRDLDEAISTYERYFGGSLEHRVRVEDQGVEAASVRIGWSRVELLAPLGDDTPVGKFLANRGPGMHHVAYEVEDVRVTLQELAEHGAELIDTEPRRGMFGLEVAFVHPDSVYGVLTEVVSSG